MLEIAKAISFLLTVLSLYPVLLAAFFEPNTDWQQRMIAGALRLIAAGCIAVISGLVFTWPSKNNPDRREALLQTLPVKLFLWSAAMICVLFFAEWYLRCGGQQNSFHLHRDCF